MTFALALRYWKLAVAGVLVALLGVQTVRLHSANASNETLAARLALANAANQRMIDEGNARHERAAQAANDAKPRVQTITTQIETIRNAPPAVGCETPPSVLGADL